MMTNRSLDSVRSARPAHGRERIAIVGIGCRLPGASTPAELWQLLERGGDAIRDVPNGRFDIDALYDPTPATPGKVMTRRGGFVDRLDEFDAEFFGISAREAERLDPQQRLLLETAWEAIEDAGVVPVRLPRATGVFVGLWTNEYESRLFSDRAAIDFYMTIGSGRYAASGRLSYFLGLQGPSLTLDTGCSSSLVAVHLACQSLWSGESEMALAGGANAIVEPFVTIAYSQSQMMAPDGRCKFGDARADGYVRSDGAGMIVLKRLSQAVEDGDRIYATIAGSAVTNDGRSSGFLTTPGIEGQEEVLRRAYRDAGILPGDVHYVEAHGTGTRAGDPVELQALGAVLAEGRAADRPCRIGSIKTNIGHTEGAAGIAGLIKTALCLSHRAIPPSLHLETPNPNIPWSELPIVVPRALEAWPSDGRARAAGVSSFGISGTNAHVVLLEAPPLVEPATDAASRPLLLPISGHTPAARAAMAASYRALIQADGASAISVCAAAGARRTHHAYRVALAAPDRAALLDRLDGFISNEEREGVSAGEAHADPRVVFVFPGQGSQWVGMGRGLYASEPAFRSSLDECDAAIRELTGWSVVAELMAPKEQSRLSEIDVIQPALFAMEVALAALWRSWGIAPAAVVGHSMGEVAAACVAGALSLGDAARVICRRSELLRRVSGKGAMAVVELTREEAEQALAGRQHLLSVAVSNSARSTVISGDREAINDLIDELEQREIFCRPVKVDVASHSPQMDPLRDDLRAALSGLSPRAAAVPVYSTVNGTTTDGTGFDPEYWVDNLRKPVLFGDAVQRLLADGHTIFVEMSPHPILTAAVREGIAGSGRPALAIGSTRREEDERTSILGSLGAVYTGGGEIDWTAVYPEPRGVATLPPYAFQRERYWIEAAAAAGASGASVVDGVRHPLIGRPREVATDTPTFVWSVDLRGGSESWLRAHRVYGRPVCSAAMLVEIMAAAVSQLGSGRVVRLESLAFVRVLALEPASPDVQLVAALEAQGRYRLSLRSRQSDRWVLHATCVAGLEQDSLARVEVESSASSDAVVTPGVELYERLARAGAEMLEPLRVIDRVTVARDVVVATLDRQARFATSGFASNPAVLDGCFQLSAWADLSARRSDVVAPPAIVGTVRVRVEGGSIPARMVCTSGAADGGPVRTATVRVVDDEGRLIVELLDVELPAAESGLASVPRAVDGWLHAVEWIDAPVEATASAARSSQVWVIVSSGDGLGAALADGLTRASQQVLVTDPEELATLLAGAHATGRVDHLVWVAAAGASTASEAAAPLLGLSSVVAAAKAPTIHLVTTGAQVTSPDPFQAALWGFGRVLGEEHPDRWGHLIDLDPDRPMAENVRLACAELLDRTGAGLVAFRAGRRLISSFRTLVPRPLHLRCRPDASYLISGGLGEIGLRLAGWLVDRGARRVVLAGRTLLAPRAEWGSLHADSPAGRRVAAIRALERRGAHVRAVSLDVADASALERFLQGELSEARPPIAGVLHCAGVVDDRLISGIDADSLRRVLDPKIDGAWNLHKALASAPLDFFILCSSVGALLGQVGQATYAAANAFLDALAARRRSEGLPALSIGWGGWADIGFAATEGGRGTLARLAEDGIGAFTADEGLDAFERALSTEAAHVAVFPADWTKYAATGTGRRNRIAPPAVGSVPSAEAAADPQRSVTLRLQEATPGQRPGLLREHLIETLAGILRRPAARIDSEKPMASMGLDSLMAVEYRRRLELSLGLPLSATLVWNYPTIERLAAHVAERLQPSFVENPVGDSAVATEDASVPDDGASEPDLEALLAEIEQLSEEEAAQLLADDSYRNADV